MDSTYIQVS